MFQPLQYLLFMAALQASLRLNEKGLNSKQGSIKITESFKGLRLDLYGFCLVILPLDIR